jgi:hypothetical protein
VAVVEAICPAGGAMAPARVAQKASADVVSGIGIYAFEGYTKNLLQLLFQKPNDFIPDLIHVIHCAKMRRIFHDDQLIRNADYIKPGME